MLIINSNQILNLLSGVVEDVHTGQKVMLGSNEIALLQYMIDNPAKPLSKAELLEQIWHTKGVIVEESSLLQCVSTCRKALQDRKGEIISTIRGVGYQFNGDVSEYSPQVVEAIQGAAIQPSPQVDSVTETNPTDKFSLLRRHNSLYLMAFISSVVLGFVGANTLRAPWIETDYTQQTYSNCNIQVANQNEPIAMFNVTAYQTGKQVILIDENDASLSYIADEVKVRCE